MAGLLWNSVALVGVIVASFLPLPAGGKMARDCASRAFDSCPKYELTCDDGQNINITEGYFVPNRTTSVNCNNDFRGCATRSATTNCCNVPATNTDHIPFNKTELTNVINQCVSQTSCSDVKPPYRPEYILSYLMYHCYNAVTTVSPSTTVLSTVLTHPAIESFSLSTASEPGSTTSLNVSHTTSAETSLSETSGTSPTGATSTPMNAGYSDGFSLSKTNLAIIIGAAATVGTMAFIAIVCCVVKRRRRSPKRQNANPEVAKGPAGVSGFPTNYDHAYADVSDDLTIAGRDDNSEYDHIGQKDVAAADHYDTTASVAQALRPPDDDGSYDFCELTKKTPTKLPDNIYSVVKSV